MSERGATIQFCGEEHELILTTAATKEINRRYGGLDKLGEAFFASKGFEEKMDESIWLFTLLINQGILTHNVKNRNNPEKQKQLFTEEEVEILTVPADFVEYNPAIQEALQKGATRNVKSEESQKNTAVG